MPRAKQQTKMAPLAVHVFVHDHTKLPILMHNHDKRHDAAHAESLGRYRMNMMENDTYADVGLKALHRFRQEHPNKLETLKDGEALHVFLTEPSPALSQETPRTPSANAKTKSAQSQRGPATPNHPKPAKGTSSNPDRQAPASGRALGSSTEARETAAVPTPQIEISSDSSNSSRSSSADTDRIFMGRNLDSTQKPDSTPKAGTRIPQTSNNDGSGSRKVSSSLPKNRAITPAVKKQVSSSLPMDRTPVPAVKKIAPGHEHPVQPRESKELKTALPSKSPKSPKHTPSNQNQQGPASSLQTAPSVKADALPAKAELKTPKSKPAPSRASASSAKSRNLQKDVYDVPSDSDNGEIIPPQQNHNLRARVRALQDDVVPSSPLPQKAANKEIASSSKQLSTPKAQVIPIKDGDDSLSKESDDEVRIVAKTPDSYTLKNTRGTHSVPCRKGNSTQREATDPPSSSAGAMPGSFPCARPSTRKSADLIERLREHNTASKKRLEEEAAAAAEEAAKEKAEAEARSKRVSGREAIDQIKKMTNRRVEPKTLIEEIPDSFFEDTDLSDDHLGDDIIKGPLQSQSSMATATPKDETPRIEVRRRQPTPTTAFTPINTLYPKQQEQQNSGNTTGKTFGLNYPKHFRDRFSDAEQSDEDDDNASVGSEDERFWRGEVLDDADGLPKAFKEYSWKYNTLFVSLGDRGYTYVGNGPWEGLILNGRHRGKYVFGCEPPNNAQIAEEEKNAEPRSQSNDCEESEVDDDDEDDTEEVQLPPCSLDRATPSNSTTPTARRQTAQDAKVSDESDLRSADSEASSVLIRKQLEAECPPSNQQLGILMSSSPSSKAPTARSKPAGPYRSALTGRFKSSLGEDEDEDEITLPTQQLAKVISEASEASEDDEGGDEGGDETILPPKPLAEITGSAASDDEADGKGDSQNSRASALNYVLRESPRWLNNLTTTGQAQENRKGPEQDSLASSPSKQRQKPELPSSSAPPRLKSYTPIPLPVIPGFTAAKPNQTQIEHRKPPSDFVSERKRLASELPKSATQATGPTTRTSALFLQKSSSSSSSATQKPPKVLETSQKQKKSDNLWGTILSSPAASAATASSKSSSKKRRRRDSEVPAEEPSPCKEHKTDHHQKDKSTWESYHEKQQQGEYSHDDVVGGETAAHGAGDADAAVLDLKHARKDGEHKKKRKHKHGKTPDGLTTPCKAAQVGEVSSRKKSKSSKKRRKSLGPEDTPSRKKRKHNHDGHDSSAPAAITAKATTQAPMPKTPPPPPTTAKPGSSSSTPLVVIKKEHDEEGRERGKSPAMDPNSIPVARRIRNKKSRMKNRRRKQSLGRNDSVSSTTSLAVAT
ncbi:hypothetical protein PG994_003225 [Apiospora phragmitis]|uniref:Uncharacterized protein n=1 Tax=Apiospora phragmitis TaxID=2905665 RepID=A0ABR1VXJ8_9PEZI